MALPVFSEKCEHMKCWNFFQAAALWAFASILFNLDEYV